MTDETQSPSDTVTVGVDTDRCIGAGQCEMMEDQTFLLDDETSIAGIIGNGQLPRERAQSVVDTCPSGAIHIVHDGGAEPSGTD